MKRLEKMATFAKGRILDLGFAKLPNPYLKGYVVGLDIKHRSCPPNYRFVLISDIEDLCFTPSSFDTILAGEFIEHLEQPVQFLRDCRSLLQSGGTLVLSTPNPYYPPIILLNWFMVRKYFYSSDHVFEIAPRYMVRLLERTGFALREMLSGGILLPVGRNRYLTIPVPKAICYHMIYVAEAI
jgi:SAM-dependent methyltransferase